MAQIEIKDVITEGIKPGNITPIKDLTEELTIGILAYLAKTVNQPSNVFSDAGLGTYGLSKMNLEDAGVMKRGIGASDLPGNLETVLDDVAVFTGRLNVLNVNSLLNNETIQRTVLLKAIEYKMRVLEQQGLITDTTDEQTLVVYAGLVVDYTVVEIKDWVNGSVSAAIDAAELDLIYAQILVNTKAASALAQIKGIGGATVTQPVKATSTVKTADVDSAVDELIGSSRIASTVDPGELEEEQSKTDGSLSIGDYF